jgi:alanine-synthesizing transaminase
VILPARRIANVRYAIRAVVAEARKLEAQGREVLYLNVGDPLKFDFATPPHLVEAVVKAMHDGHNGYAPSPGITAAREAVARAAGRARIRGVTADDVIITTGATEAIELALTGLLDPGDSVLLPSPGYPLYNAVAAKIGAEVIPYELDEERDWAPDADRIGASVTPRTRAIVIGNPNNPTGAVYHRAALEGLLAVARAHRLVVLSDEIYDQLTYERPHVATASLADDVPIVTFGGLSKSYLACGWRTGWMIFCNTGQMPEYRTGIFRLADARLSSPLPAQFAVAPALDGSHEHVAAMMAKLVTRRDLVVERIRGIPGMSVVLPRGAFYAMPRVRLPGVVDDEAFVLDVLRATGVLLVHGSGFGERAGTQHFRIVLLPPLDVLSTALDRVAEYVRSRWPGA